MQEVGAVGLAQGGCVLFAHDRVGGEGFAQRAANQGLRPEIGHRDGAAVGLREGAAVNRQADLAAK